MLPAANSWASLAMPSIKDRFILARSRLQEISGRDPEFRTLLTESLSIVGRALDKFGYQNLAMSFNGGKDACVVLYLLLLILAERDEIEQLCGAGNKGIKVVYFQKAEFPEMVTFMEGVASVLRLDVRNYSSSYQEGMQDLVNSNNVKAVLMGQRRGDPWTDSMEAFTPSSPGWPKFIRINPALEWTFGDVWRFLRAAHLPYCHLYDEGYTSMGEPTNTLKNKALLLPDGTYRPAYELVEEHLERSPRTSAATARESVSSRDSKRSQDAGSTAKATWDEKWEVFEEFSLTPFKENTSEEEAKVRTRPSVPSIDGACISLAPGVNAHVPGRDKKGGDNFAWSSVGGRWLPLAAATVTVLASVGIWKSGSSSFKERLAPR